MTTLAVLLLGGTLLAPTGAATAASETCRGEAATIVGNGQVIDGTEGSTSAPAAGRLVRATRGLEDTSEIHGGAGRDTCTAAMRRTSCERTD